ncbi:conserved hypothetical protein [Frankia sp. Hr75.2]|nr:conserved hypothetical protein [Frankia sp. Hr75.2]
MRRGRRRPAGPFPPGHDREPELVRNRPQRQERASRLVDYGAGSSVLTGRLDGTELLIRPEDGTATGPVILLRLHSTLGDVSACYLTPAEGRALAAALHRAADQHTPPPEAAVAPQ